MKIFLIFILIFISGSLIADTVIPQSINVLMAKTSATSDLTGYAVAYLPLPSTDREVTGGQAWFTNYCAGDYIVPDIYDKDNVLGHPSGPQIIQSWADTDEPTANQGWFATPMDGVDLKPLVTDDPSKISGGTLMYLRIRAWKGGGVGCTLLGDTLFVNVRWGSRNK